MKILYFFIVVLLLINCKSERKKITEFNTQHHNIQNYVDFLLKEKTQRPFNGVILISENGKTIVEKAEGYSNFDAKTKNTIDTQFIIASLTKQITAALILKLEEEQKLSVNDTIAKFLPDLNKTIADKITIHQLLNHTSGLKGKQLTAKPGEEFNYSNYGYILLGNIIEKAGGKSYDDQALALFNALGMNNTTTANLYKNGSLATGYNGEEGIGLKEVTDAIKNTKEKGVPAGGVISTAKDLVIWNESLHNGKVIQPETYAKMISKQAERENEIWGVCNYGYGLQLSQNSPKEYYHAGYLNGYPSANLYFPDTKTSVIILENVSNSQKNIRYIFDYQIHLESFMEVIEKTNTQQLASELKNKEEVEN